MELVYQLIIAKELSYIQETRLTARQEEINPQFLMVNKIPDAG